MLQRNTRHRQGRRLLVGGVQCDTNGTVACLVDTDGSETLELWFFGLPNTFTFSKGRRQKSVRDGDELGWRVSGDEVAGLTVTYTERIAVDTIFVGRALARSTEGGETAEVEVEATFNVRRDCANGLAIEPPLGPVSGLTRVRVSLGCAMRGDTAFACSFGGVRSPACAFSSCAWTAGRARAESCEAVGAAACTSTVVEAQSLVAARKAQVLVTQCELDSDGVCTASPLCYACVAGDDEPGRRLASAGEEDAEAYEKDHGSRRGSP